MKFATTTVLALALGASATIVTRDLATIQGVLSDISKSTDALDTAVKGFSGDFGPLQSASDTLLSTIKGGVSKVSASDPLPLIDAATVAQSVVALNTSAGNVISDLIAKKDALVSAGKGADTLKTLQDQRAAAKSLADAITSKVPTELQGTAAQLSQGVDDSFARGIAAFQNTGGSGPSSSAPGSSSASATATSASSSHGGHSSAPPTSAAPTKTAAPPPASASSKPATFTGAAAPFATGVSGALAAVMAVAMAF
jgi:uncharacterized protein YoxC